MLRKLANEMTTLANELSQTNTSADSCLLIETLCDMQMNIDCITEYLQTNNVDNATLNTAYALAEATNTILDKMSNIL